MDSVQNQKFSARQDIKSGARDQCAAEVASAMIAASAARTATENTKRRCSGFPSRALSPAMKQATTAISARVLSHSGRAPREQAAVAQVPTAAATPMASGTVPSSQRGGNADLGSSFLSMVEVRSVSRGRLHVMKKSRLVALFEQRCPQCREGRPFQGLYAMAPRCPVCGTNFEREPGYWLGALYFSYGLALALVLPVTAWMMHRGVESFTIVMATLGQAALWSPLTYRYARLFWMYLDQAVDPR